MEILKIVPTSNKRWASFLPYLQQELDALQKEKFHYCLTTIEGHVIILQCIRYPEHLSAAEAVDTFRHFFSTALAEYLVEEEEEKHIQRVIKQYFGYGHDEVNKINKVCQQVLCLEEDEDVRDELKIVERKCKIFKKAYSYLEEEKEFNLEGFIRFRLKSYHKELYEVIEYAVDEYIMDKEYQEFIQLLRYFISIQEPKLPFLHVFQIDDQQFLLFNEQGEQLSEENIAYYLREWTTQPLTYEDLIVSTLVNIAPRRLVLHTSEPFCTVIHTLKNIFQDQLSICTHCLQCQTWKHNQVVRGNT